MENGRIEVEKEVLNLEDGIYTGTVKVCALCENGNILLKILLTDGVIFTSFIKQERFGKYPYNLMFMARNTNIPKELEELSIKFEILNNTSAKNGHLFSNITKIQVITDEEA